MTDLHQEIPQNERKGITLREVLNDALLGRVDTGLTELLFTGCDGPLLRHEIYICPHLGAPCGGRNTSLILYNGSEQAYVCGAAEEVSKVLGE